nr:solute carrier family 12 member 1-like [Parasteatoda tepidariorum]
MNSPRKNSGDSQQTRFQVSTVGVDNPGFESDQQHNEQSPGSEPRARKLSIPNIINSIVTRKSSIPKRTPSISLQVNDGNEGLPRKVSRKDSFANSIFLELFKDSDHCVLDYQLEAAPRLESYTNSMTTHKYVVRPSLEALHQPTTIPECHPALHPGKGQFTGAIKFGWIKGVYIRCLLNIWGVMLFLRMGWMTGQCGIILATLIVLLSTVVTVITTLSMSAICTNGDVRGGGAYYLISRSLGPEFGGVVGILLFLANAVSGALYILGAGEAIRDILRECGTGLVEFPSDVNDIRVTSVICLLAMMSITGIGMAFENKTQMVLLVILLIAMMDYFVGACFPAKDNQIAQGFVGFNGAVGLANMGPDFRGETFFSVFAVFFPSVTGILAGANISGDLKDPCMAIPKGTLLSILTTSVSYIALVFWLGFTTLRDASGSFQDYLNSTLENCTIHSCHYGLQNDYQVMKMASGYGPIIYGGIFAATLSSALVSIVSAPRILQKLHSYSDLNAVAPIISNFFMAANGLINFSCFHASYVKSPGFRPGFRYYNKWLSLMGALLCVVIMFVMNWITALVTDVVVVALYMYISKTCPDINWGSSFQGFIYRNALYYLNKLQKIEDHVKNFRPAVLVLSGNVCTRPQLVDFAAFFTKDLGLHISAHISKETISWRKKRLLNDINSKWLLERKLKSFYCLIESDTFVSGVDSLIQTAGIGKMKPNIIFMGFKTDWNVCNIKDTLDYFEVIHDTIDAHMSLCILRVPGGTNFSKYYEMEDGVPYLSNQKRGKVKRNSTDSIDETAEKKVSLETVQEEPNGTPPAYTEIALNDVLVKMPEEGENHVERKLTYADVPPEIEERANMFQKKQKGYIDVWWLYDDGGMTMLLPYILKTRSQFKESKLRVFSVAQDDSAISDEQLNLAALLQKFRIPFTDLTLLPAVGEPLNKESTKAFETMVSKFLSKDEFQKDPAVITRSMINTLKKKTNQFLRLRELLEKHSKNSDLIIMTAPLPRKEVISAPLYMAWLDTLTRDLPPFLLVRGNQTSVLTFYS